MKKITFILAALIGTLQITAQSKADFIENFTSDRTGSNGQVLFQGSSIYLASGASPSGGDANGNSPYENGFVLQNNNFAPFSTGGWGLISQGQGGPSDYYLYEGTNNGSAPSYVGTFWESYTPVAVAPNTNYIFSFYLTNSEDVLGNLASVEPFINGTSVGSAVSAKGYFTDGISGDGWQKFAFQWNSGSATTAVLQLENMQVNGYGNDFGVDTIALTTIPEPSSVLLVSTILFFFVVQTWRRNRLISA